MAVRPRERAAHKSALPTTTPRSLSHSSPPRPPASPRRGLSPRSQPCLLRLPSRQPAVEVKTREQASEAGASGAGE
jgi:hypothetical protein